jgi:hypothetical protein
MFSWVLLEVLLGEQMMAILKPPVEAQVGTSKTLPQLARNRTRLQTVVPI